MRIFIPENYIYNIEELTAGSPIGNYYHYRSLSALAELFFVEDKEREITKNIYTVAPHFVNEQEAKNWFRKMNFDGIFIPSYRSAKNLSFFAQVATIPIIVRIHAVRGFGGGRLNLYLRCYSTLREYDALAPVSNWSKQYLLQFVSNEDCIHVIPNGVDTDFFHPIDKREAKRKVAKLLNEPRIRERLVVGFLSRFQVEKGAKQFLQIAEHNKGLLFLVVGKQCNDFTKFQGDNVVIVGTVKRKLLPLFYNSFDIYCFPSLVGTESFGLSALEAMACGVPPVVTDFDGIPEVVGDAGIKVETTEYDWEMCGLNAYVSPQKLSEKIKYLAENRQERIRLGERARERSLFFSWDKTAQQLIDLFTELKERGNRNRIGDKLMPVNFFQKYHPLQRKITSYCVLQNKIRDCQGSFPYPFYTLPVKEGLVISLLRNHTINEVEAVLVELLKDREEVQKLIRKVITFFESMP